MSTWNFDQLVFICQTSDPSPTGGNWLEEQLQMKRANEDEKRMSNRSQDIKISKLSKGKSCVYIFRESFIRSKYGNELPKFHAHMKFLRR